MHFEIGYRHIDTAVMYSNHEPIGEAIKVADVPRDEVTVSTKVPPDKAEYAAIVDCIEHSCSVNTASNIQRVVATMLDR